MGFKSFNRSSPATDFAPDIPEDLQHSADKILTYADISTEKAGLFKSNLELVINMKDKSFTDPASRQIREQLSAVFFETYTAVLKKLQGEKDPDRLYLMFLYFGYMDERLVSAEQAKELYELAGQLSFQATGPVYNLESWLTAIYDRTLDPSINEFGLDYQDVFLEKKRKGELTDKDKSNYEADSDGRLAHETDNLFKLGQRLCFGQVSGYLPILHKEMIGRDLQDSLVTPAKIRASLDKILAVDFSAFHREIVYPHTNQQLAPELIMKPVLPDFILMPCYGHRAVMWQVLSGKSKNTPGRFIFPIFTNENLDDMMVEVVAKFRWDLAKNMSNYIINKANEVSLYLEYSDYIQFYAKNKNLSREAKEKLKDTIKRNRHNTAEIFALDYHTWINYEANGLLRLNKVAREIMFKYCPFSRSVRNNLAASPLFASLINQFDKSRDMQCRILEARYAKVAKPNTSLDPDLVENLAFYNA